MTQDETNGLMLRNTEISDHALLGVILVDFDRVKQET